MSRILSLLSWSTTTPDEDTTSDESLKVDFANLMSLRVGSTMTNLSSDLSSMASGRFNGSDWRSRSPDNVGFLSTLGFQLEDMFQFKGTPQGIDHVMFQFKDMPCGFKKNRVKYKT